MSTSLRLVLRNHQINIPLPWVLRHCWMIVRRSIWPVKNWLMRCWHGYLSDAGCKWLAHGPSSDATATPSSLASLKSRTVLPCWCLLTSCPGKEAVKRTFVLISDRNELKGAALLTEDGKEYRQFLTSHYGPRLPWKQRTKAI